MNELKSKNKGIAEAFAELLNKVFQTNNSGAESTYNLKRAIGKFIFIRQNQII